MVDTVSTHTTQQAIMQSSHQLKKSIQMIHRQIQNWNRERGGFYDKKSVTKIAIQGN